MGLSALLLFSIIWARQGHTAPLDDMGVEGGAQFESPGPSMPLDRDIRRYPTRSDGSLLNRMVSIPDTTTGLHAHPRSLLDISSRSTDTPSNSSSSSITHPLLIGIVIGVIGTLSVFGLVFLLRRVLSRKNKPKSKFLTQISIPLRPSAPREFRHLEHFTTTLSDTPTPSTASSLRVAHRRPDGSWEFTESRYAHDPEQGPDPTLPVSPSTIFPTSPLSPLSDSSETAFSYDDASSSKTGPPPYITPYHKYPSPDKPRRSSRR